VRGAEDTGIAATETVSMNIGAERTLHIDSVGVPVLNWSQRNGCGFRRSHNFVDLVTVRRLEFDVFQMSARAERPRIATHLSATASKLLRRLRHFLQDPFDGCLDSPAPAGDKLIC